MSDRSVLGAFGAFAIATLATAATIIACAGTEEGSPSSSTSSSGGPLGSSGSGDAANVADQFQGCATDQKKATTLPLDLYVMFDSSLSMAILAAQGNTKYSLVSAALGSFVSDPGSEGIGVGLQFFPLPASCTSSAQCGGNTGPCTTKVCESGPIKYCNGNGDCPGTTGPCVDANVCTGQRSSYCTQDGLECDPDPVNGFDQGQCQQVTTGYCSNGDSCVAADYATPAVAIGALPGNAGAIKSALAGKLPAGATPTSAALQGAIDAASSVAKSNAGSSHAVVVVFVTDGLPLGCDENIDNIAGLAGTALGASPSIKTFVIGVFREAEQATAQQNLDKIANKGGSNKAFLVSVGASTTTEFIDAMNGIRGEALPCEYDVPKPTSGTPDFNQLNIQRTEPGGKKTVYAYAKSASTCDSKGGWYYDQDPSSGGKPSKIILCPTTCGDVKVGGGQIDVVIGCQTVVK